MNKTLEALKKILPEAQVAEVTKAIEEIMAEKVAELEAAYSSKLDEAYEQLTQEKKTEEDVALEGYKQAYEVIASLMNRLDEQKQEFDAALKEGFDQAYSELQKEKGKNNETEVEIYEEYDKKLKEMKELMVDKVDQFLSLQEGELYETAKKDVLKDPRVLEQKIAVQKMAEILSDYISNDEFSDTSSAKLEEAYKQIEALKGQIRIVESKNVNLSRTNTKLHEQVTEANKLITESVKTEKKERANRKESVSGRGQRVVADDIIKEHVGSPAKSNNDSDLVEDHDPLNDLLVLAGLQK